MTPFLAGVRGAAWVAVAAVYASGLCWKIAQPGGIQHVEASDLIQLIPGTFFLLCLSASTGSFRKPALLFWIVIAFGNLIAKFVERGWGEIAYDLNDPFGRQYHGYTFLSDGLFAFGCSVLVVTGLLLSWREWKAAPRA